MGLIKKKILDLLLRKSEKCLCENEIVVPSTIRVLGISAEVFLIFRIYRFYAFPRVFNAVPVGFKMMIVAVVSITLFENCRKHVSVFFIFLVIPFFYLWIFYSYDFFNKLFLIEIDF